MKPDGRNDLHSSIIVWVTEFKQRLAFTLALSGMDNVIIIWVLRKRFLCNKFIKKVESLTRHESSSTVASTCTVMVPA